MNDHPTTPTPASGDLPPDGAIASPDAISDPFPAPGDPFAARYVELRRLGWEPSAAFMRAYRDAQGRAGRAWIDTDDTTTPDGGVA